VDLLTVVMHEMGHTLGYQDLDSSQFPQALMALQLMPEQARRAPTGPLVTGTNPIQANDVNADGNVTPTDVLLLINRIDASGGPLTAVAPDGSPTFYDVSADNFLSALDVLRVVNYLNTPAVAQLSDPVLDSPSSTGPLVVAPEIIPSAPVGASPTTAGPPAPATDQVVLLAAGMQSPVPVWPAAEGEDWLDDLAAAMHAAQPDELAADALFQELGEETRVSEQGFGRPDA
ncbi:MAG: dockerin type I domain-containing protein, partial [Planctomycetota bacterium]|nr:dockerin type I domain-containing protein [Planctomycetota bacterium]